MAQANPVISSRGNAQGAVGVAFSFAILASGGGNLVYTAGSLPAGLSINSATGVISGTPTIAGGYNVPITVKSDTGWTDSQIVISISA